MSLSNWKRASSGRAVAWAACLGALSMLGGQSISGSASWVVGNVVVCIGSGTCRIYSGTTFTTIQVPNNPKQATGGTAWAGTFDAWVVDSRNQKVLLFSKNDPHNILKTIDTSLQSSGKPGPIVVDSADSIYVGMYDAATILKYDRNGSHVATIPIDGGWTPAWMDLADDHKTLWFTTASSTREIKRIDVSTGNLLTSIPLPAAGTAGGLRLLPLLSPYNGTGGFLIADGLDIKRFTNNLQSHTYDVAGEDGWRTVTLEPNGTHFLAATGAGKIYRFPLAGGAGVLFADTGSNEISGLTIKGGDQLNIRPLNFAAGANVQREAIYGNPAGNANQPFPRHSIGVKLSSVSSGFTLVTSNNWVTTDGMCTGDVTNDYDCRTTTNFGSDPAPSPRCIPYVSSNPSECVFYRFEDEPSQVSTDLLRFIDFLEPGKRTTNPYVHPACTGDPVHGNPRMLRDPDPVPGQYEQDITVGITRTTATDPIFGGGKGGSDYGAFDRCLTDGTGGTFATINKPTTNTSAKHGSSMPWEVSVVDANGQDVTNAVMPPNNISLLLRHSSGLTFLEPQQTPGSSPAFFELRTVKMGKSTRTVYAANLNTSQLVDGNGAPLLGSYVGCISSINTNGLAPGLFAPVCAAFSIK